MCVREFSSVAPIKEEFVNVPWHADETLVCSVIPFYVHTCKFILHYVNLDTIIFLKEFEEMVEMVNSHVFHSKVVNQ